MKTILFLKGLVSGHTRRTASGGTVEVKPYQRGAVGSPDPVTGDLFAQPAAAPVDPGPALAPAPVVNDDMPARLPALSLRELDADNRDLWRDLHEQHNRVHYHEIPRLKDKHSKTLEKAHLAGAAADEHRRFAEHSEDMGDFDRAKQHEEYAERKADEAKKHYTAAEDVLFDLENAHDTASMIGKRKGELLQGTHDIRFDHVAQRMRSDAEEVAHAHHTGKRFADMERSERVEKRMLFRKSAELIDGIRMILRGVVTGN